MNSSAFLFSFQYQDISFHAIYGDFWNYFYEVVTKSISFHNYQTHSIEQKEKQTKVEKERNICIEL